MSVECPACSSPIAYGATECECGWNIPSRKQARGHLEAPQPRPHTGHFKSQAELHEYERDAENLAAHFRHRLSERRAELDQVPRGRRWAKEILIRKEEGDPRVTPTMLDMAREALHVKRAA